jgi:hypothetical protein
MSAFARTADSSWDRAMSVKCRHEESHAPQQKVLINSIT